MEIEVQHVPSYLAKVWAVVLHPRHHYAGRSTTSLTVFTSADLLPLGWLGTLCHLLRLTGEQLRKVEQVTRDFSSPLLADHVRELRRLRLDHLQ